MLEGIFRCHPVHPPPFHSVYSTCVIPRKCSSNLFLQCWALHSAPGSQDFMSFTCRTFFPLRNLNLLCCSLALTEHMGDGLLLSSVLQLLPVGRLSLFSLPKQKQANSFVPSSYFWPRNMTLALSFGLLSRISRAKFPC